MNNCESDKVKLWRVVQQTNNDLLTEYTRIYNELALILSDLVLCCDETNGSYNDILNRLDVLIQNLIDCCEAICDGLDEIIDIIITPFPESLIGYVVEWKDHICEEEDDRFPPESWEIEYEDHICQEVEPPIPDEYWHVEFEDYICEEVTDIGDAFIVEWEDHVCQQADDIEWPLIGYELEYIDRVCQEDWECDVTGHLVDIVENEVVIGYGGQWIDYTCVIENVTTTTTTPAGTTTTTTEEVFAMCIDAMPYLSYVDESVRGHMDVGELISATHTIGDYVIDWYLNGVLAFSSGTSTSGETDILFHPFDSLVEQGTYTPKIRWAEINGEIYYAEHTVGYRYSPDLLLCLDTVFVDGYTCSNGGTDTYSHTISYNYLQPAGELAERIISLEIEGSTRFIAWEFRAFNVVDELFVYYKSGTTETLIDAWAFGGDNIGNDFSLPVKQWDTTQAQRVVNSLEDFVFTAGDKVVFKINPSGNTSDWVLSFKCLDTLNFYDEETCTPFSPDVHTIDSSAAIGMVWNSIDCRYELTYQNKAALPTNNFTTYFNFTSFNTSTGITFQNSTTGTNVTVILNKNTAYGTTTSPGVLSTSCKSFDDIVTYAKVGSVVTISALNDNDYTYWKNAYNSILGAANMSNYSADNSSYLHYKLVKLPYIIGRPTCPSDAANFISINDLYTHCDLTNISFNDVARVITINLQSATNGMIIEDCNNGNTRAAEQIALSDGTIAVADFSYGFQYAGITLDYKYMTETIVSQTDLTGSIYNNIFMGRSETICNQLNRWELAYLSLINANNQTLYKAYIRVVITDPTDETTAVDNFDLYTVLDSNGQPITNPASYTLVYRKVAGVGTWYI